MGLPRFLTSDGSGIDEAARLLREGAVIGFPTDTVYGLAALASDEAALLRIYEIKGRPRERPLVLMVADRENLDAWVRVDERARHFMDRWWPGALTLVL